MELGVVCPLKEAGMGKDDIRILSKEMNLPTWDKPAFACLSSRFPYGQKNHKEKLEVIDRTEQFLMDLGFRQVRVRHHGDMARIEVSADERRKIFDTDLMDRIHEKFRQFGFAYVALDLKGYRTREHERGHRYREKVREGITGSQMDRDELKGFLKKSRTAG